jgi:two-component system chemotaxis response regulator CheB
MTKGERTRVLIADDSPTARALLAQIFSGAPDLIVVGEATDGWEAVELTQTLAPDIITMDVRMPRLDGYEATQRIMMVLPTPIVIVSAAVKTDDVVASLQALRAGALTVAAKPVGPGSPDFDEQARDLIQTVRHMAQVKVVRRWALQPDLSLKTPPRRPSAAPAGGGAPAKLVAIAASTGGPAALQRVLGELPADLAVPIVVVQHIAAGFVDGLVHWLDQTVPLSVQVARPHDRLEPGHVYLAPDDQQFGVGADSRVHLSHAAPVDGFRPSATWLFRAAASAFGAAVLAVVLTGMGRDGADGLESVHRAGGRILAQDEASSVVYGMPAAAAELGLAHAVLPLSSISSHILQSVERPRLPGRPR